MLQSGGREGGDKSWWVSTWRRQWGGKRGQVLVKYRNKWGIRIYPVPGVRQETRTSECLYSCVIKSLAKHVMPIPILTAIFISKAGQYSFWYFVIRPECLALQLQYSANVLLWDITENFVPPASRCYKTVTLAMKCCSISYLWRKT